MGLIRKRQSVLWAGFSLLAIFSFCREPDFFLFPRIWAEEGSVYIQSVFRYGIWNSLFLPHLGYYSAFNNLVVGIGLAFFGIDGVAFVTTWFSFVVMLLTVSAPLYLKSPYWKSDEKKLLISCFALIASPGEIWLNTINAQFYFCLFSCFVLLSTSRCLIGWRLFCVLSMFFVGVLTGVTSVALFPFFVLKLIRGSSHRKVDALMVALVTLGVLVQIAAFTEQAFQGGVTRFSFQYLSNLPAGLLRTSLAIVSSTPFWLQYATAIVFVCLLLLFRPISGKSLFPLILAGYIGFLFTFLSLGMGGGERYGYPVAVLVFVFLVHIFCWQENIINRLGTFLTAAVFVAGIINFGNITMYYEPHWLKFSSSNILRTSGGGMFIMVFPQGTGSVWRIEVDPASLEKYK